MPLVAKTLRMGVGTAESGQTCPIPTLASSLNCLCGKDLEHANR